MIDRYLLSGNKKTHSNNEFVNFEIYFSKILKIFVSNIFGLGDVFTPGNLPVYHGEQSVSFVQASTQSTVSQIYASLYTCTTYQYIIVVLSETML